MEPHEDVNSEEPSDAAQSPKSDKQPRAKRASASSSRSRAPAMEPFAPWDFEALRPPRSRSQEYNEQRLAARRRLEAIGKHAAKQIAAGDGTAPKLAVRTSIHNPFPPVNGGRVERLWAYLTRNKAAKTQLRRTIGAELAKDLDHAYKNGYLCVALEPDALEVSFRIHQDGWYDGRNLVKRVKKEGFSALLELLNQLEGFRLRLDDWKGEWPCGALTGDRMEEYFKYYEPGEHLLAVERRWPAPESARDAVLTEDVPASLAREIERLVPLYRFSVWSSESDHLFG